ncbi:4Fe-4S binding protein [Geoglobus sp.]
MIIFDYDSCIRCGKCEKICPSLAIVMDGTPILEFPDKCWHCCACIKECPSRAIRLRLPPHIGDQRYELLAFEEGQDMVYRVYFDGQLVDEMRIRVRT